MEIEILDNINTVSRLVKIDSIDDIPYEDDLIFESSNNIDFVQSTLLSSKQQFIRHPFFYFDFRVHSSFFSPFPIEMPKETDNFFAVAEERDMELIANNFLSNIEKFENQGKKYEAIKEAHKLFEDLLSIHSFDLADQVLNQASKRNFSLAILIAFLASSLPFKNELPNRDLLFQKAEMIAVNELGQEKLGQSIFNKLK